MNEEELFDALDGLFAYDSGSHDSGIHDERLRERVKQELTRITEDGRTKYQLFSRNFNSMMARLLWQRCLSPEAIQQGYGYEDMRSFLSWLHNEMGVLK